MDELMIDADHRTLIKAIRGAPFTILGAIGLLGGRAGPKQIGQVTGYADKTITKALEILKDARLITRTHRYAGWVLTNSAHQMVLSVNKPNKNEKRVVKFTTPPTTTAINTSLDTKDESAVAVDENISLLKSAGVGEPMRSRIANLDHVNPEYIKAHAAKVKREKKSAGMLIHRLRSGDQMPETKRDPESERAKYVEGEYSEFIDH